MMTMQVKVEDDEPPPYEPAEDAANPYNDFADKSHILFTPAGRVLPRGCVGERYETEIVASGGAFFPLVVAGGALPPGVVGVPPVSKRGEYPGSNFVLRGTPTAAGVFKFVVVAQTFATMVSGNRNHKCYLIEVLTKEQWLLQPKPPPSPSASGACVLI
eukprot:TRINITY_DN4226_c0_g1_i1.p1 TRINITY_DN4226_c0_g1~~TRINITY_DN4226_c0_g1_i1.p1  ORF type:complete len:186 (+),score=69.89 TRINITY_DN4226_c0_g1_i1:82-558(+)